MEAHFARYSTGDQSVPSNTATDGGGAYTTVTGYMCSLCNTWVPGGWSHVCPSGYIPQCPSVWTYPSENKTEKAYAVLKKLVEMKIIPEPETYKVFCDLIEGIKGAL